MAVRSAGASLVACACVCMVAPFFVHRRCPIDETPIFDEPFGIWMASASPLDYVLGKHRVDAVPPFGSFFVCISAATGAVIVMMCRIGRAVKRHNMLFWVKVYVAALITQAVLAAVTPWTYAVCSEPRSMRVLVLFINRLVFVVQTVVLMLIALVRLRIIGADATVRRGYKLLVLFCAPTVAIFAGSFAAFLHGVPTHLLELVGASAFVCALGVLATFHCNSAIAFWSAVTVTKAGTRQGQGSAGLLQETQMVFASAIASPMTTLVYAALFRARWSLVTEQFRSNAMLAGLEMANALDVLTNTVFVLSCAGFVGPERNMEVVLEDVRDMMVQSRRRQILETMRTAARNSTGSARALAALFAGEDEEALLVHAIQKFRRISWSVLKQHPYLVTEGHAIDGQGPRTNDVYALSEPCQLSQCDAFWSHSWHDSGELKWASLTSWCEQFAQENGRAPYLWFDLVCIDQASVEDDLRCLPIFLAGCNTLLVTAGLTYASRLWCCLELFVYVTMCVEGDSARTQPAIRLLGNTPEELSNVREAWRSIDISRCECAYPKDRERIISAINSHASSASTSALFASVLMHWLPEHDEEELEVSSGFSFVGSGVSSNRSDSVNEVFAV